MNTSFIDSLNSDLPNCGLVALAVVSGYRLEHVTEAYQQANLAKTGKRHAANWKGRTYADIREIALDKLGVVLLTLKDLVHNHYIKR